MTPTKGSPVALFDSGVGGLSVMKEITKLLPQENIIYLGDTARLPYGNKSPEAVLRYTLENVSFLLEKRIKLLIVACFTASTHALEILEQKLSIPVLGVIQCGIETLMKASISKRVAVLGTSSTVSSGVLQSLIRKWDAASTIFPVACPLFVPFIEEGLLTHRALKLIAADYLTPLKLRQIDAALLACTHYPLIRPIIQNAIGPDVKLIEPAIAVAGQAKDKLQSLALLNDQKNKPLYQFYATDDPEKFRCLASRFLGSEIDRVSSPEESHILS